MPKRFADNAESGDLASLEIAGGQSIGYSLRGAAKSTARVDGAGVTYAEARPHSDVHLEATPSGIKETVILKSRQAPAEWEFPLRVNGLTPSLEGGSVLLKDAAGVVQAVIPPGYMEDSAVDPRSGNGAQSRNVQYSLSGTGNGVVLRVSLDRAWLDDPARVYVCHQT